MGREEPLDAPQGEQEAQQAQEPEHPCRLQGGGQEGRGEDHHGHFEGMLAQPGPAVGNDAEHGDQLREEGQPDQPVGHGGHRAPGLADFGLFEHDDRDDEQRRHDDGPSKAPGHPLAPLVHQVWVRQRLRWPSPRRRSASV